MYDDHFADVTDAHVWDSTQTSGIQLTERLIKRDTNAETNARSNEFTVVTPFRQNIPSNDVCLTPRQRAAARCRKAWPPETLGLAGAFLEEAAAVVLRARAYA